MRQAGREFPDPRGQSLGTWQPALTRNLDSTAASPVTGGSGMTEVFDVDLGILQSPLLSRTSNQKTTPELR